MAKKEPSKIKSSPIPGKESGLPLCLNLVDHVTSFEYQEKNFLIVGGEESKKAYAQSQLEERQTRKSSKSILATTLNGEPRLAAPLTFCSCQSQAMEPLDQMQEIFISGGISGGT